MLYATPFRNVNSLLKRVSTYLFWEPKWHKYSERGWDVGMRSRKERVETLFHILPSMSGALPL